MFNNSFSYNIQSYEDYTLKNDYLCLNFIFEKIIKYSDDDIIITDSKLNILFSNSEFIKKSDNILTRLHIRENQIEQKCTNITRHLKTQYGKLHLEIFIEPIYTNSNVTHEGYLFIIKNLSFIDKYKDKFDNMIAFFKHDLKTPILSQIMALKLIMKNASNKDLLPEVLNSCETTYRMVQNIIDEDLMEKSKTQINKKDILTNVFIKNVEDSCKSFLKEKGNSLVIKKCKDFKINIDSKKMKKALVNIIYQINERCHENQPIYISFKRTKRIFTILIKSETKVLKNNFFNNKYQNSYTEEYEKLGHDNGLSYSGMVINGHQGKIRTLQKDTFGILSIYLPI